MPPLRVAVVGTGAFGRNHLRVYRELELAHPELVQLVALVDPIADRRSSFASTYNIAAFASVADLLQATKRAPGLAPETWVSTTPNLASVADLLPATNPGAPGLASETWVSTTPNLAPLDAVSVCVPTTHHAAVAEQLLLAGIDVLIEKPFAATLAQADHILALAQSQNRIVAIGHLERFNPAVAATLAALHQPMFFESHRLSVFTPRSLDVDVVLDLMIHDLDIVLSLTNSPVREVRAVGLPILSRKTDIANVRVEFQSGCVANFTASRVSTEQVRKLRLFQPHQYLSLDFARQELLTISVDPVLAAAAIAAATATGSTPVPAPTAATAGPTPLPAPTAAATAAGPTTVPATTSIAQPSPSAPGDHPTAGLSLTKSDIPKGEPLRLELEDFLQAVRTRTQPRVPAQAGREALALALTINDQIAAHAHRAGLL